MKLRINTKEMHHMLRLTLDYASFTVLKMSLVIYNNHLKYSVKTICRPLKNVYVCRKAPDFNPLKQ
jgi:hypothetical protein